MKTKLDFLIKECEKNAPNGSCEKCSCNEKECILNLIEMYNVYCDETEEIDIDEQER